MAHPPDPAGGLPLYYIEDDPALAGAVQEYLCARGFAVRVLGTAGAARAALLERQPAAVLLDWNLPDGGGDALCRWLRLRWPALPVLGYAQTPPLLREEYPHYSLTVTLPFSLWQQLKSGAKAEPQPVQARLLAAGDASLAELDALEQTAAQYLGPGRLAGSENRVREKQTNDQVLAGFRTVLGAACAYLALIGLASVFAHTLGFVRLRRREIARYESIGMTPAQLRGMFMREALTLAGRPVAVSLALGGAVVAFMIRASYLDPAEFWAEAPVLPILGFVLAVFLLVGLAYWLGGRALLAASLAETLRDEAQG